MDAPSPAPLTGALLVGGDSRRMGQSKALLPVAGTTLGLYLARLLERTLGAPPILVGEGPISMEGETRLRAKDRIAGGGPLSALLGLFDSFPGRDFLALAVDLPAMSQAALRWLAAQGAETNRPAVWPRLPGRPFGEPLAAIYRVSAAAALDRRWRDGERSLKRALLPEERFEPPAPPELAPAFVNINRPEEWRAFLAIQGENPSKSDEKA